MNRLWWSAALAALVLAGCGGSGARAPKQASAAGKGVMPVVQTTTAALGRQSSRPRKQSSAVAATGRRRSGTGRSSRTATTAVASSRRATHAGGRHASGGSTAKRVGTSRSLGTSRPVGSSTVVLAFHGGGRAEIQACGAQHHDRTYPVGTTVKFSGTVSPVPSGTWKVKLKIKVCTGGAYTDFEKLVAARDKHHGTFSGSFSAPPAGAYEARAVLYLQDTEAASSDKEHFAT